MKPIGHPAGIDQSFRRDFIEERSVGYELDGEPSALTA